MKDAEVYVLWKVRMRQAIKRFNAMSKKHKAHKISDAEYSEIKTTFDAFENAFNKWESAYLDAIDSSTPQTGRAARAR